MRLIFSKQAWEDYQYWLEKDKKVLKKINDLLKELSRNPDSTLAKAESLRYELTGFKSMRIDKEHRLVFNYLNPDLFIISCRFHY
ncbi:Txe/YoeB family addiction module toxin [Aquirufa sp. ROCK-SH2]